MVGSLVVAEREQSFLFLYGVRLRHRFGPSGTPVVFGVGFFKVGDPPPSYRRVLRHLEDLRARSKAKKVVKSKIFLDPEFWGPPLPAHSLPRGHFRPGVGCPPPPTAPGG